MNQTSSSKKCIGIVGLGLIGGSLGLDLQKSGWKVNGLVHRESTALRAIERGLAQTISTDPKILNNCEIVILALPIKDLLNPPPSLINALPKNSVLTDVGSVKSPILKVWEKLHPNFVPSHPMAGTNKSGVEAGQLELFKNCPWISTPNKKTNAQALQRIEKLAISLGSKWMTAEAGLHDQAVALISHLPVLISAALLKTLNNEQNPSILKLAMDLASTGFIDTSRVGGGNPNLGRSIVETNNAEILKALSAYRWSIESFEEAIISQNWNQLEKELEQTKNLRNQFLDNLSN